MVSSLLCAPTISDHGMSLYEIYSTHAYIVVLKLLEKQIRPGEILRYREQQEHNLNIMLILNIHGTSRYTYKLSYILY